MPFMPFLSFWILPLISAATWLCMLLAMLIVWAAEGHPHYVSMSPDQRIVYISGEGIKPLFVTGCCVTTISLDLAFLSERWLRHKAILAPNIKTYEKVLSTFSTVFALLGTFGLILLSVFDTVHHPKLHRLFLLLFMLGYVVSAVFVCSEYQRLGIHFREHRVLRMSFWVKLLFIIVEVCLSVGFGVCLFKAQQNPGAALEWIISFVFTFYILTFLIDLFPATRANIERCPPGIQLETGLVDGHEECNISYSNRQLSGLRLASRGQADGWGLPNQNEPSTSQIA